MIVQLTKLEMGTVVLNMAVMRQNVRNGFKRNYGKKDGKAILASYDDVKTSIETELTKIEESEEELINKNEEIHDFHFNVQEVFTFSSFMDFYIGKLKETLDEAGNIKEEDQAHLNTLHGIKAKLDELKEIHQVG